MRDRAKKSRQEGSFSCVSSNIHAARAKHDKSARKRLILAEVVIAAATVAMALTSRVHDYAIVTDILLQNSLDALDTSLEGR